MSELAAAAAILTSFSDREEAENIVNAEKEVKINLAVPENDSISSEDDEEIALPHENKQRKKSFKWMKKKIMKEYLKFLQKNKYQVNELWKKRFTDAVPGVIGIRNHGNTCFINAILQCLSYTDILAEYFVLDLYKGDLKKKKKAFLFSYYKREISSGEVTEQLATLLKSLWSLQYDPEISIKFKSLVEKHASQYKGGSQHDAQEFLLWLLDRVHEDLNVAKRTKKKFNVNCSEHNENSDEVLAAESLANYMRSNSSFVMDVFQAQFRSSLTCPACDKQSNTFDPFLCVSLPIPQKQLRPVFVTVLYIDQTPRQVKLGVTIGVHETIGDLRSMLSKDTGINSEQILLVEIDSLTFRRTFKDTDPVSVINTCDLYCIEVHPEVEPSEEDLDQGAFVRLAWINVLKEGERIENRFGSPYTTQVSREILYGDLQKLLMKEMASILHDDILIGKQKVPLFKMRLVQDGTYLDSDLDLPLYSIDPADKVIQIVLEWDAPAKSQIIAQDQDDIEEHASVKQVEKSPTEANLVTLQECFDLYTKAEKLGDGDAWFCPQCKRKQQVVKKMGLWSLPDVLIIHLKRFRQLSNNSSNKLSTMVECPLESYDMSPFVTNNGKKMIIENNAVWISKFFNTERKKEMQDLDKGQFVYDLYAVCNHHGDDLQGGHYTATCKNPTDGQWYNFDDINTSKVDENDVVTQDAYILFYQKQSLSPCSSSSSSSSSTAAEHWVYRMPDFKIGKNQSHFVRNGPKYATMQPTKSESDIKAKNTVEQQETKSLNNEDVSRPIDKNDVD